MTGPSLALSLIVPGVIFGGEVTARALDRLTG